VLIGTELEIRSDGRLDYPDDVLAGFEIVTASIHSAFNQPRAQITQRLIGAMQHPLVTAISHPTGRLLERRDPYDVDMDALIDTFAAVREFGGPRLARRARHGQRAGGGRRPAGHGRGRNVERDH